MTQISNNFSPQILDCAIQLRAYLSGQESINQIIQWSATPLLTPSNKLNNRWEMVKWEIYSIFQDIYALFLCAASSLLNCLGVIDLAKRCHVASRQEMASTLFLTHFNEIGDNFLMISINTHRTDTSDLYLHPFLEPSSHPLFEIQSIDKQKQGINFFHWYGVCRGMSDWFFHLYFKTQAYFTDPDEHIKAVTQQFEAGAPREASLLHSLNEEAPTELLNLDRHLNVLQCNPICQTDKQIAEELCTLPPGTYALYSSCHRVNWINLGGSRGYFYNPSFGSDRIQDIDDLTKSIKAFIKTHHPFETNRHIFADRIVPRINAV